MADNVTAWIKRADEILATAPSTKAQLASEAVQFATPMLTALYGAQSTQVNGFLAGQEAISRSNTAVFNLPFFQCSHAHGAIHNAKAEIEAGLIVSLRVLVAGEIIAELVRLGKETLQEPTDAAKNVAAVLIAAAFEDLIRRMGQEFASVADGPDLQEVIDALKNTSVLRGGQIGTAQSFLKFRNDSLHADWSKVDRSQVQSCIGFIDALLLKHFS